MEFLLFIFRCFKLVMIAFQSIEIEITTLNNDGIPAIAVPGRAPPESRDDMCL